MNLIFRYNMEPKEMKEEESLNLTSAIWFAWGVLLNSGIGTVIIICGTKKKMSLKMGKLLSEFQRRGGNTEVLLCPSPWHGLYLHHHQLSFSRPSIIMPSHNPEHIFLCSCPYVGKILHCTFRYSLALFVQSCA